MPHSRKVRGKRAKAKPAKHLARESARTPEHQLLRLQKAITKSNTLNHPTSLSSQAEGSARLQGAAPHPADAGETGGGSESELPQSTTLPRVIKVSVDSDSDLSSPYAASSSSGEDLLIADPPTTVATELIETTTTTAPDGRRIITTRLSLKKF